MGNAYSDVHEISVIVALTCLAGDISHLHTWYYLANLTVSIQGLSHLMLLFEGIKVFTLSDMVIVISTAGAH